MLHWIDCDSVYLCSHGSFSFCIGLSVTLFVCVLVVIPHCDSVYLRSFVSSFFALDWLWHCLSVFIWFFLMLHWFDSDIVCLCSCGSSSCCIGLIYDIVNLCSRGSSLCCIWLIVILCICVHMVLLMLHWIDCGIVYLCSHGSSSCCIGLIVALFICVLIVLPHIALDWLWHCLSVFFWFSLVLHWIDLTLFNLCSYGSTLCCIG